MIHFVNSLSVSQKRVLLRVDFNVSLDAQSNILDDFRIRRTLPTIKYLLEAGADKIIIVSHLGRPTINDRDNPRYSLRSISYHLEHLIGQKVYFLSDAIDDKLQEKIQQLPKSSIVFLENIRFFPEENKNDKSFARQLASLADVFINDAFSVSQRQVASLCAITDFLPSGGGLLLREELNFLKEFQMNDLSLVAILGGAKMKEKIPLIHEFIEKGYDIVLGGAIANVVLKAWGENIGSSLIDNSTIKEAKRLQSQNIKITLPRDFYVLSNNKREKRELGHIENNDIILDIGPQTVKLLERVLRTYSGIIWNGPVGKFEDERFRDGTKKIIDFILQQPEIKTVVGGGDTLAAFRIIKPEYKMLNTERLFFSTGGGAMLKYLAGETLPALQALDSNI